MTAISYRDRIVRSPGGAFRLEARSPYNLPKGHPDRKAHPLSRFSKLIGDDEYPTFQRDFQFTLYKADTDRVLWTLDQARVSAVSPSNLFVSDRGWSVVKTSELVGISPRGERTIAINSLAELRADPSSSRHVIDSTAGPIWEGQSHAWFEILDGREHFCMRTWWGARILIDLELGRRASADEHRAALVGHEKAWTMKTLESFDPEADESVEDWDQWLTAITLAGRSGFGQARDLIRPFERVPTIGSTTCGGSFFSEEEEVFGDTYSTYTTRPFATLALRRLGGEPQGFPSYAFPRPDDEDSFLALPEHLRDISIRARSIGPGMPGLELVQLLGAPDVIQGDQWSWDTEKATTIKVKVGNGKVESVETLHPPGWVVEANREATWII